ncbi:MAG TPA: hypothetical protein VM074_10135 [Solimonas sp.]|nr:hypothetical protein [Solimonas sp.]
MNAAFRLALRDVLITLGTLVAWALSLRLAQGSAAAIALACLAGLMAVLVGFLAHEWGHYLGARAARATVYLAQDLHSPFLFRFDSRRNSRTQFLWMSMGGFIASAAIVALYLLVLPRERLGGLVALGLTVLGVIATAILELPPAWRVWRGGEIPSVGAVYDSPM